MMKISSEEKITLDPKLFYNSDFSDVVTIKENKFRSLVNSICVTSSLRQASLEAGVSDKMLTDFCGEHDICSKTRILMRRHFRSTKKKINLRFDYEEQKQSRSSTR